MLPPLNSEPHWKERYWLGSCLDKAFGSKTFGMSSAPRIWHVFGVLSSPEFSQLLWRFEGSLNLNLSHENIRTYIYTYKLYIIRSCNAYFSPTCFIKANSVIKVRSNSSFAKHISLLDLSRQTPLKWTSPPIFSSFQKTPGQKTAETLIELWKPIPARSKFTDPTKLPSTFMQAWPVGLWRFVENGGGQ